MKHIYAMGLGLLCSALLIGTMWTIARMPVVFLAVFAIVPAYFLGREILDLFSPRVFVKSTANEDDVI